jgi:hypothetical protein
MFDIDPTWEIDWQKVDLSDGFWRMIVEHGETFNFVFQLPPRQGDTTKYYVIPAALQMGWKNSPAYFCLGTEGARELIRRLLALTLRTGIVEPHRHEALCVSPASESTEEQEPWVMPESCTLFARCFVDDFMNGLAGEPSRPTRRQEQLWFSRATMHAIHAIFPPPDVTGREGSKDSISEKKLLKGDARFKLTEELLGFEFTGAVGTGRTVGMRETKKIKYQEKIDQALHQPRGFITLQARRWDGAS